MFEKKFPTKRTFQIFRILRINGMTLFCKLICRTTFVLYDIDVTLIKILTIRILSIVRSLR